jgi:hypothetical protein
MSYDLQRLRLKGLITRLPHTNTYVLTDEGQRVAIFYTKVHNRLLRPLLAAHDPPAARRRSGRAPGLAAALTQRRAPEPLNLGPWWSLRADRGLGHGGYKKSPPASGHGQLSARRT